MHVIGTAGHVDHGKSTLIAALTGTHPDRLKEEKEREMTIDLGFGWFSLPDGEEIGIVDVPGHSDFIGNMLAGVGGLDAALLVIAADEGVMPQTREHLAILNLLQIDSCLVVLSKIDLIEDPGWLNLIETDIRTVLQGSVFHDAPILRVSSKTKAGFPELIQALELLLKKVPPRPDLGRPRLPVDRVFSMPGFGTVVTGTLVDGCLSVGDEVEILPSGLKGRVRGLQTHKKKEELSYPGSRTAVNLSGLDVDKIQRGDVIVHPAQYQATKRMDVQFHLLAEAASPIHHHTQVKLFIGTSETIADIRLLGSDSLEPGRDGWLQLELHKPVVAVRGDRYILRRPSPSETLGGGKVADPQPKNRHKRFNETVINTLESITQGSPSEVLLQASLARGPARVIDVINHSRLDQATAENAFHYLIDTDQIIRINDVVIAASQWSTLKETIEKILSAYHKDHPLKGGIPREELKSKLKVAPWFYNAMLPPLVEEGFIVEKQKWIALPGHVVHFSPFQQIKVDKLMEQFTAAPFAPPSVKECLALTGEDIFNALLEMGELLTVSEEVVFKKLDYKKMVDKICQEMQNKDQFSLAEVRDIFQTSRRYIQALLEHLDAISVTERNGDFRKLKRS